VVESYRIAPTVDVTDTVPVYRSAHRSPYAAARRLATIIADRSDLARSVRRSIQSGRAGMYAIVDATGQRYALNTFRGQLS
jgi:hypothetical protein